MPKTLGTPSVNFYLDGNKKPPSKPYRILAAMFKNGVTYRYPAGEAVLKKYWDAKAQRVHLTKVPRLDVPEFERLNNRLDDLARTMKEVWDLYYLANRRPLTNTRFNELVSAKIGKTVEKADKTLLEFAAERVESAMNDRKPDGGYTSRAISLKNAFYFLCAYSKKYGELQFESITPRIVPDFYKLLYQEIKIPALKLPSGEVIPYEKKALEVSSANQILTSIIQFVNEARTEGLTDNIEVKDIKKEKKPRKIKYAFEIDELIQIYETDFTGHRLEDELRQVRLLTAIGTWSGMRQSDWGKIDKDMVKGEMIEVLTQKTGAPVAIPLFPVFRKMLDEANWQIPEMRITRYNELVKEMCRVSGIDSYVLDYDTSGGKTDVSAAEKVPKWQRVSSHYCRRFFIRLMLSLNTPVLKVMSITGHDEQRTLFHYAGLNNGMDAASQSPEQMQRTLDFLNNGSQKVRPMVEAGDKMKVERKTPQRRARVRLEDRKKSGPKPSGKIHYVAGTSPYTKKEKRILDKEGYQVYLINGKEATPSLLEAQRVMSELRAKRNYARIFINYKIDTVENKLLYSVFYKPVNVGQTAENV